MAGSEGRRRLERASELYKQFLILTVLDKDANPTSLWVEATKYAKGAFSETGSRLKAAEDVWETSWHTLQSLSSTIETTSGLSVADMCRLGETIFEVPYHYCRIAQPSSGLSPSITDPQIDFEKLDSLYQMFVDADHATAGWPENPDGIAIRTAVSKCIGKFCDRLQPRSKTMTDPAHLRFIIILLYCPFFEDLLEFSNYLEIVRCASLTAGKGKEILRNWFVQLPVSLLARLVEVLRLMITITMVGVLEKSPYWEPGDDLLRNRGAVGTLFDSCGAMVRHTLNLLQILWDANVVRSDESSVTELHFHPQNVSAMDVDIANVKRTSPSQKFLPYKEFHDPFLNELVGLLKYDFLHWIRGSSDTFGFMEHIFVLTTANKALLFRWETQVSQSMESQPLMLFPGMPGDYLVFSVRRSRLLEDALNQVASAVMHPKVLKKPIKVQFLGEPGVDGGGLTKEFFQLLTEQLFNPEFGMFKYFEDFRCFWFNRQSLESAQQFRFVGVILGLALYNGVIMEVKFPRAVYKKLLSSGDPVPTPMQDPSQFPTLERPSPSPSPLTVPASAASNLEQSLDNVVASPPAVTLLTEQSLHTSLPPVPPSPHSPRLASASATPAEQPPPPPQLMGVPGALRHIFEEIMRRQSPEGGRRTNVVITGGTPFGGGIIYSSSPQVAERFRQAGTMPAVVEVPDRPLQEYIPSIRDLEDWQPDIANSLRQVLRSDPESVDFMELSFAVTEETFGEFAEINLPKLPDAFFEKFKIKKPMDVEMETPRKVTAENREEYVATYLWWHLCEAPKEHFQAFYDGFHLVCGKGRARDLLRNFDAEELELALCGMPGDLDFLLLKKKVQYKDGFDENSLTVKHFWEICEELTQDEQKKLLFFITGSDRVPLGGLQALTLTVGKSGTDKARLPSAHTCFNYLLLPDYEDKDLLRNGVQVAIKNCLGFGLR